MMNIRPICSGWWEPFRISIHFAIHEYTKIGSVNGLPKTRIQIKRHTWPLDFHVVLGDSWIEILMFNYSIMNFPWCVSSFLLIKCTSSLLRTQDGVHSMLVGSMPAFGIDIC